MVPPTAMPGKSATAGPRSLSLHTLSRRAPRHVARTAGPTEPATSLIPQTLDEMDMDTEQQALLARLAAEGQAALTREEEAARRRSLAALGLPSFSQACTDAGVSPLVRGACEIFQINIGLYCNQACGHCHVESSPRRTAEQMTRETAERCVALLDASPGVKTLDITGGAPELNSQFRYLVTEGRKRGLEVIDRCNLTVLSEPGQEDTAEFLAANKVRIVASLPCYTADNVDAQRGRGVFERSIAGLKTLNALGYGIPGTGLILDLVYNPGGVFLAPEQSKLEGAYRQELRDTYGIEFSSLLCLNNMPIKRWADELSRKGKLEEYMGLLVGAFNPAAGEALMCRSTVSVNWEGRLFDCDFNQQLDMALGGDQALSVFDVQNLNELTGRRVAVASHCYGCTAGAGSSCQGATT